MQKNQPPRASAFAAAEHTRNSCLMPLSKGLFCLLLLAGQTTHAMDIGGIALGSQVAEARAAAAQINPKLQFTSIVMEGGKSTGFVAKDGIHPSIIGAGAGFYEEILVLANGAGKVWYVVRNVNTSKEGAIEHRKLMDEVTKQYGGPSSRSWLVQETITWARYRSGKMYVGAADQGPCGLLTLADGEIPGTSLRMPLPFKDGCGTIAIASVPRASTNGKTASYSISIVDAKALRDEARKPAESLR